MSPRFVMLTRKNDAPLDFDFDKAIEQSRDNPVFYVQYAHARVRSVMRKAEALHLDYSDDAKLEDDSEFAVAKKSAEWPRLVEIAARNHEPQSGCVLPLRAGRRVPCALEQGQ